MINTQHLLKVTAAWASIVYVICFGGVVIYPQVRQLFMRYALHVEVDMGSVITPLTFVTGLILWNIVAILAVWLFAVLFNKIRQ
ncbi:DUF5676 family membrane protein [Rhizobium giardinii]|uniref:DUF5676 family membrane protein n=1 Tax=Rhizobium giardinii TaxID=56731 RepID=UPI003D6F6E33